MMADGKGDETEGKGWGSAPPPPMAIMMDANPPPTPASMKGMWQDTLGNAIEVTLFWDRTVTAWLTGQRGSKQLSIWLDPYGRIQCGNGVLHQVGYMSSWPIPQGTLPSHLAWRTQDWRISTWQRTSAPPPPPPLEGEAAPAAGSRGRNRKGGPKGVGKGDDH